jgi:HEAT repeat protein
MRSPLPVIRVSILACLLGTFTIAQVPQENAWTTLNGGLNNKSWEKRVKAVSVLGELTGDKKAEAAAINALKDDKEDVRRSAAQSLGELGAKSAIPQLMEMTRDNEPSVILAAARALVTLGDDRGYNPFYAVLTGETKTGTSLTDQQKKTLKDPKKMAGLGLQMGAGFVPFGGLAMGGYKMLSKDDASPVLAAAALVLAKDPDPKTGQALAGAATQQGKWLVRAAAFDAIARRGDPSLLPATEGGLKDKQDEVQYSAAGAVIRLCDIRDTVPASPKTAPSKGKAPAKKSQ